jgi:hypothetical protein
MEIPGPWEFDLLLRERKKTKRNSLRSLVVPRDENAVID